MVFYMKDKKILVNVVTPVRGFLKDLFEASEDIINFKYGENLVYEINSKRKLQLATLVKNPLFNYIGLFQVLNTKISGDVAFSYNRFLHCNRPYVLYLENPLAPFHYVLGRNETIISKMKLRKLFADPNLKEIICLSKACESTLRCFYSIPSHIRVNQIYPLVNPKVDVTEEEIKRKSYSDELICLYISADFELKGGQDILEAFKQILDRKIKLIIVTKRDSISEEDLQYINNQKDRIQLLEFNLKKEELQYLYKKANLLLSPSRQDSFPLVTLEAMNYGNVVISTDLYAIKEMVTNEKEGFLVSPKYQIWNEENMPNKEIWNHRSKTIYSSYIDTKIVRFLVEKIEKLNADRMCLDKMAINAFCKAKTGEFSVEYILNKWEVLIEHASDVMEIPYYESD